MIIFDTRYTLQSRKFCCSFYIRHILTILSSSSNSVTRIQRKHKYKQVIAEKYKQVSVNKEI